VWEERGLELRLQLGDRRFQALDLTGGLGGQLGVVNGNELARIGELVLGLFESGRQLEDRLEATVLPAQLSDLS
jgi:hypothetical protein